MTGWLVVNEFLNTSKFTELTAWIKEAADATQMKLEVKTNTELLVGTFDAWHQTVPDFVLFWDKDIRLATALEYRGIPVFNGAKAIEICDDKSLTQLVLEQHHIPTPKTILGPKTYEGIGYHRLEFLKQAEQILGYPMVVKECFGSFGQQVYLVNCLEELEQRIQALSPKPFILQQFISYSKGRDVRLQVVGDQVVCSMYRYSDNGDFRANLTNGGKMKQYEPTKEEKELALQCTKAIGLDFAGVDLLFGEDGHPLVCEVNSNAHIKSIYELTGVNAADCIMHHIKKKLEERR